MDDLSTFLKEHQYFCCLDELEQKEFISVLSSETFSKDDVIFKKGDSGDRFFIVKNGLVRIFIVDGDNEETIAIMKPGDVFGELSMCDIQPRSAYASALASTTLLVMIDENFEELKNKSPRVASKIFQVMLRVVSKRLRLTTMKLFGQF